MSEFYLSPPIAFLIYFGLVGGLYGFGRLLSGPGHPSRLKSRTYSSGEAPPLDTAAPGYRPFFVIALFFAILHLGVLVLGSSGFTTIPAIYLAGIFISLVALILG